MEAFKRLKSNVDNSEGIIAELTSENEILKQEMTTVKESSNTVNINLQNLQQEYNKLTMETYNLLYNIRHKFENNPKLTQSLNMQLRFDFTSDRHHSIIELASMIGDITNILNFEIKNTIIKESQFTELKN
jgi:predicted nuclease with TOPRIM domain